MLFLKKIFFFRIEGGAWHTPIVNCLMILKKGCYTKLVGSDLKSDLETLLGYDFFCFLMCGGGDILPFTNDFTHVFS